MALRRGKKDKTAETPDKLGTGDLDTADAASVAGGEEAGAEEGAAIEETPAPRRPLDESEAGENPAEGEGEAVVPRLDLGSIRIPVFADLEVRIDLNEQKQPIAASLMHSGSALQLLAFAAPRGVGIWDEVRAEIAESVAKDGGIAREADGIFGPELRATIQGKTPSGEVAAQPLRFVGFDGPRWFVRGVFSGPAATDPERAAALEAVLTRVVVVRGDEPMAPRDPLPLRLPSDVGGMAGENPAPAAPSIDPFTRGPEITQIQ